MCKKLHLMLIVTLLCLSSGSCDAQPQRELFNVLAGKDHHGPVLIETEATGTHVAVYHFDEFVRCDREDLSCPDGDNTITLAQPFEHTVRLTFSKPLVPGKRQMVTGRVSDMVGNTLSFTAGVWGHNPRIPGLLINEFVTKGNASHPDRIELLVTSAGNLAGVTIYDGMSRSFDSECILPSREVKSGDLVVIEYGERLRGAHAIEYWGGETGLGANNGVIGLYNSPEGKPIDAVLYSNRTSDSDTQYEGFGTRKVQERAKLLEESGAWGPLPVAPQTGVDSTYSTATRSFCRTPGSSDSDTKTDWHIAPTGKASFGEPNTSERYEP